MYMRILYFHRKTEIENKIKNLMKHFHYSIYMFQKTHLKSLTDIDGYET